MRIKPLKSKQHAFTMVELLVGIAIIGILAVISFPSLSRFTIGLRVDSEVSELHRLILMARNTAVTTGNKTIICPIVSDECSNKWNKEISLIEDVDGSGDLSKNDVILRVKAKINTGDQLTFSSNSALIYSPSGNLFNNTSNLTFSYCPKNYNDESKGVVISILGRPYITQDFNNDGFDEDRDENKIECT